jgi:[ribosomal protein S5]-alanine N-acetyltransferase
MRQIPTLVTHRLLLCPFTLEDAPTVKELAGEWEIAEMTATIPHPYEQGMAEAWISKHQDSFEKGEAVTFAVTFKPDGCLVGAISLVHINQTHRLAELGYWIGKPFWNNGYCTEASQEMIRYAFKVLDLNRVQARHLTKNPASGRVMHKAGMKFEGILRQSVFRWGKYEDTAIYSILREEW